MLAIQTILHPTDFSPLCTYAFRLACSLARDRGARLLVLHVRPPEILYAESPYVLPPDPEQVREYWLEQLREVQSPDPAVAVEHVLKEGNPVAEILGTAREYGCDLIVMGTHGRSGVSRLLLGSVAEQILRKANCPVLTVKGPVGIPESSPQAPAAALV
jgi:nucleotide-binding universal stress UspA family protein